MSIASTTRTIKCVKKSGVYACSIITDAGDVYQEYMGDPDAGTVGTVYPNFEETTPILYLLITSSRSTSVVTPKNWPTFTFDGVELAFNSSTNESAGNSNTSLNGVFKRIAPSGSQPYYGLQLLKNVAALCNYKSCTIGMTAAVASSSGSADASVSASYTVRIGPLAATGCSVHIVPGDNYNFVISEEDQIVALKAMAWQFGNPMSGLTYKWYKMISGAWVLITNSSSDTRFSDTMKATCTSQTLNVEQEDVATYSPFKVEVYENGELVGSDAQGVWDVQDPYDIEAVPTRLSGGKYVECEETIYEGDSSANYIRYAPKVVSRNSQMEMSDFKETKSKHADPQYYFFFSAIDSYGVEMGDPTTQDYQFTVTESMMENAQWNEIELIIESAYGVAEPTT